MKDIYYYRPETLDEALSLKMANADSYYISGGTDLMVQIRAGHKKPSALISLRNIPELDGITYDRVIRIGSATRVADLSTSSILNEKCPVLVQAANAVGSIQTRNSATIGGNLCNASPAADTALALLVLDASIELVSSTPDNAGKYKRRVLLLDDFFTGPGETVIGPDEVMTAIIIKPPGPTAKAVFSKKGRVKMDLSLASSAVLLEMDGDTCVKARVAVGSVAPKPLRLRKVENYLEGKILSDFSETEALLVDQEISPISDVRCSAEYRRQLARVLVRRSISNLAQVV